MNLTLDRIIAVRNTKTVYRDGDLCLKVFNEEFKKSDVLNEALNQARIEETGLNVPKVLEVTAVNGKWTIVSQYIKGKTLLELMEENPSKKEEYLNLFVDLQLKVQSKTCKGLNLLKDKWTKKIMSTDLPATLRYKLYSILESTPNHDKVLNGDFNPSNIIMAENQEPYIVDWSHATQGNASADAALTYILFCLNSTKETADEYLDMFCKKSDTKKQYVEKWIPLAAAVQLTKCHSSEKEFLTSLVY